MSRELSEEHGNAASASVNEENVRAGAQRSVEEADRHLLLDVRALERRGELVERDELVSVAIGCEHTRTRTCSVH